MLATLLTTIPDLHPVHPENPVHPVDSSRRDGPESAKSQPARGAMPARLNIVRLAAPNDGAGIRMFNRVGNAPRVWHGHPQVLPVTIENHSSIHNTSGQVDGSRFLQAGRIDSES